MKSKEIETEKEKATRKRINKIMKYTGIKFNIAKVTIDERLTINCQ